MLFKSYFFSKGGDKLYNVLQQVTMRHNRLQKIDMDTTFKGSQEVFFLIEREKLLQQVAIGYNALRNVTKTTQPKD